MKKLIIGIIALVALCSCNPDAREKAYPDSEGYFSIYAKTFEYRGHKYIEFKDRGLYGHGFVHDPDCPCHENK